jgi:hypothetical protein
MFETSCYMQGLIKSMDRTQIDNILALANTVEVAIVARSAPI